MNPITSSKEMVLRARQAGLPVPAFNIPYLPMMEPVIRAVVDQDAFALVEVARVEWMKFESRSTAAVYAEFQKYQQPGYVCLHLDHVPVIDEDQQPVDYLPILQEAIRLGYQSVMIDASRLDLEGNIAVTHQVAALAHQAGIPLEAELGAVLGHEAGPLPPYEEIFRTRRGFTKVDEAKRFVQETGCDWLSVAVGSVHGAISAAFKDQKKVEARLDLDLISQIYTATQIPLVLHGGSGVRREDVLAGVRLGITKINIAAENRQAYEQALKSTGSVPAAQEAVYQRVSGLIRDYFNISGSHSKLVSL
jgi:fructose-bisphosphate aldolase class II